MISDITDKLLPEIENWQNRPLAAAIGAAYPATEYQRCIVHQIRNTLKYVADKDKKEFASDLKTIYTAPDEKTGFKQLEIVTKKWETHYPGRLPE